MGPLPPQKMIPAENSSHLKASGEIAHYSGVFNYLHLCLPDDDIFH